MLYTPPQNTCAKLHQSNSVSLEGSFSHVQWTIYFGHVWRDSNHVVSGIFVVVNANKYSQFQTPQARVQLVVKGLFPPPLKVMLQDTPLCFFGTAKAPHVK